VWHSPNKIKYPPAEEQDGINSGVRFLHNKKWPAYAWCDQGSKGQEKKETDDGSWRRDSPRFVSAWGLTFSSAAQLTEIIDLLYKTKKELNKGAQAKKAYVQALNGLVKSVKRRELAASWFHQITKANNGMLSIENLKAAATALDLKFDKALKKDKRETLERAILKHPQVYATF
jgi:hypothetical protein